MRDDQFLVSDRTENKFYGMTIFYTIKEKTLIDAYKSISIWFFRCCNKYGAYNRINLFK